MPINNNYIKHHIFTELPKYTSFYENLSNSIFGFLTIGTKALCNLDSYVYSSIQGTLESINDILLKLRINDAYALLRKYYDSIIINIYTNLYLEDNFSLENFIVDKIDKWRSGKEQLPEYRIMSDYIRKSNILSKINGLLYKDQRYKNIRKRCNDHTHYNFYKNVLLNDNKIHLPIRESALNEFSIDLTDIFVLHFSYLFYLNGHYMMSRDYIDSLECGLKPEEGSQYYVAPFIQEIFDAVIKKHRMDLATVIKSNTLMMLE